MAGVDPGATDELPMPAAEHWAAEAARWAASARTSGHDAYWYYRHAFFDRFTSADADAPFAIEGSYLASRPFHGTEEGSGRKPRSIPRSP